MHPWEHFRRSSFSLPFYTYRSLFFVFLWGVSISAFQNEIGGKTPVPDSNWKRWLSGRVDFSLGPDYWHRYEEDHRNARLLGCNAWRMNVDWARIMEGGTPKERVLKHYHRILSSVKEYGLFLVLNLHHWTFPPWIPGWHAKESVEAFVEFANLVAREFGEYVDMWSTLNEPDIELYMGYVEGRFPPGIKSKRVLVKAYRHALRAHREAMKILKETGKPTGVIIHVLPVEGKYPGRLAWRAAQGHVHRAFSRGTDWIGINYYTKIVVDRRGIQIPCTRACTDTGWYVYPRGLYEAIEYASRLRKPMYITENGIADASDRRRPDFIRSHILYLRRALAEGFDVRGYFHWTLVDNLEWNEGFKAKFGLYAYDPQTKERIPRRSAAVYANEISSFHRFFPWTSDRT